METQNVIETAEEKRRRLQRERTRRHRDKNSTPEPPESFEEISALWQKNEEKLQKENPVLRLQSVARHKEVEELEAEADEIRKGVEARLRAETLSAFTPDPQNVMPMPDDSYRDIKAHVLRNGTANYRQIEAAAINGRQGGDLEQHYVRYGFRLRIQLDTLQNVREALVIYALTTKDPSLDWSVVEEAISDCVSFKGFSPNAAELGKLIHQHREASVPLQNL